MTRVFHVRSGPVFDPIAELAQLAEATEQIKARVREVRAHLAMPTPSGRLAPVDTTQNMPSPKEPQ